MTTSVQMCTPDGSTRTVVHPASPHMFRTGITGEPNLQITSMDFTRNLLLKKVSPEPAHKPGNTVRTAVQREWCVLHSRVRYALPGTHTCTSAVMRAVQLCTSTRLGCTFVRKWSSDLYSCTDSVVRFVRVYGWSSIVCTRVHVVCTKM
jgi:hypothetical protein